MRNTRVIGIKSTKTLGYQNFVNLMVILVKARAAISLEPGSFQMKLTGKIV